MIQDERWIMKYNEVKKFIDENHRNPSRHRIEEHDMLNCLKANREHMNAGTLKAGKMTPDRVEMMGKLVDLWEEYRRVNQYV